MEFRFHLTALFLLFVRLSHGQGTFVYDQQAGTEAQLQEGGMNIQSNDIIGQSFVPGLNSIGFVRLYLFDQGLGGNGLGATVTVNLRAGSINGTIIGSTEPVSMSDAFAGFTNFFFASVIPLTPGASYFLQPVVQSGGDPWGVNRARYNYSDGMAFYQSVADPVTDLWFREGIIVPEPSSTLLALLGGMAFAWHNRKRSM